jgi:PAS domain S-box-containing protein
MARSHETSSSGSRELTGSLRQIEAESGSQASQTDSEKDRMTEDHFRLMVEHSDDILTIRNADGRIRYTNPSMERVMGYTQEQMVGETGFDLIHPEDRTYVLNALNEFVKMPSARASIRYRARHANGTWVSLEVVAYNLLEHPEIRGLVINGRDISKRNREDAEKDQLIADLEQAMAKVKTLTGVLPICASCKKVREESGDWEQIEVYIRDRTQLEFSHGLCPECIQHWFPEESGS